MMSMVNFCVMTVCAFGLGLEGHLAVLGKPSAILFAMLSAIGIGLCLRGRFEWSAIGAVLTKVGEIAKEAAGTTAKLGTFLSGLSWFTQGAVLGRVTYLVFTSFLANWTMGELIGWCLFFGTLFCIGKGAAEWSGVFKGAINLTDNLPFGARLATEPEATEAARGGGQRGPSPRRTNIDTDY